MEKTITLAHGAGGKQTSDLIGGIFKKYFDSPYLTEDDAAVLTPPAGRMAMSTDGFIVSPAEFPGGNIGKLSICGTVNDLACMHALDLIAYLHAAHTFDAFRSIAYEREIFRPVESLPYILEHRVGYAYISGNILQRAVSASCADGAGTFMFREDQVEIDLARLTGLRRVRMNYHAFLNRGIAGCNKFFHSLEFNRAESACADIINSRPVAEMRYVDTDFVSRLEDRRVFRHFDRHIVYC